jgi:hypothetical protein
MDPQTLSIIGSLISSQVVIQIVNSWLASRKEGAANSAKRLDKLEADLAYERGRVFDLAVKHEGLLVRFELLQNELRACKEQQNGLSEVSHS